jgi:hypothetical protein
MEREFVFSDSAFKHGLTEADIRHAFETSCYAKKYQDRTNVILLLGFDMNANPVEILFNELADNTINVFHAMPCQRKFYYLFKEENYYD